MSIETLFPLSISIIVMVFWGIVGILVAKISRAVGAVVGAFLIQFIGLLMTIIIWPVFFSAPSAINWYAFVTLGILGGGVYALYLKLLRTGKVSIVVPILSAWALVTSALGLIFLHESINLLKILSVLAVVAGIIILSAKWSETRKQAVSFFRPQIVLALLAVLGWGFYFFFLSPISKQTGWFLTTLLTRVFVTLTLFVLLLPQLKKKVGIFSKIPWKILLSAALFDVFAFTSFNLAISKYEVSFVSIIASASPLVTVILAATVLKERLNNVQKIGVALVIGGIIGLQLASRY